MFSDMIRLHLVAAEAVHAADLEAANEQPVKAGEVVDALLEGWEMRLLEVTRQRAGEMHEILLPRYWPWQLKTEFGCFAYPSHWSSFHGCDGKSYAATRAVHRSRKLSLRLGHRYQVCGQPGARQSCFPACAFGSRHCCGRRRYSQGRRTLVPRCQW